MARRSIRSGMVLAVATAGAVGLLAPGASAAPRDGSFAVLTGGAEVPGPGDPDGRGAAIVHMSARTGTVCAKISVTRVAPLMAAHIHVGRPGVAGPVVIDLTPTLSGGRHCVGGVDPALIRKIWRTPNAYYVNVHNEAYPDGAVRGQLHR